MYHDLFRVWLNPESLMNIIIMTDVIDRFRVTIETTEQNVIKVHIDNRDILKFEKVGSGLYMLQTKRKDNNSKK